jgi:hypothetical protein
MRTTRLHGAIPHFGGTGWLLFEGEIMSRSLIILLIAASGLDSAIAILSVTKGDQTRLINILRTAANALRDYVNTSTKATGIGQ